MNLLLPHCELQIEENRISLRILPSHDVTAFTFTMGRRRSSYDSMDIVIFAVYVDNVVFSLFSNSRCVIVCTADVRPVGRFYSLQLQHSTSPLPCAHFSSIRVLSFVYCRRVSFSILLCDVCFDEIIGCAVHTTHTISRYNMFICFNNAQWRLSVIVHFKQLLSN